MRTKHEAPTPCLFFCGVFEAFDIHGFFSSRKMNLGAPKIMFIDTYLILYIELNYPRLVKGDKQHAKERFC